MRKKRAQPEADRTLQFKMTTLLFEAGPEQGRQGRQGGQMWQTWLSRTEPPCPEEKGIRAGSLAPMRKGGTRVVCEAQREGRKPGGGSRVEAVEGKGEGGQEGWRERETERKEG